MSANLLLSTSRFLLFGPADAAEIRLGSIIKRKLVNVARHVMGLPPVGGPSFWDWFKKQALRFWRWLTGKKSSNGLPADMPEKLFTTVDAVLRSRGGWANKEFQLPNFWTIARNCTSTPFFWSIVVDYNPHNDPDKLKSFESSLEDALSRAGYDYNVRILNRPLRLEIDKPKPPAITLAQLWPFVSAQTTNERTALLGQCWRNGKTQNLTVQMTGEDFSTFIAGSPGSGKTQLSLAMILSLAYSNSPARLSMMIIDPKAIDWRPLGSLPHLMRPIITEPSIAVEAVQGLIAEMDKRTKMAAAGDTSFLSNSILLYVDELSDLLNSLPAVQADALATYLQRIAQKGRGVGFIVVAATQRVYDVPASAHTKLNMRIVGKVRSASDSVAASGIPGTQTNKLPGRGSFELWSSENVGMRIQAPFVADSSKDGYDKEIEKFTTDIIARWGRNPTRLLTVSDTPPGNTDEISPTTPTSDIDNATLALLQAAYEDAPTAFKVGTVRRLTGVRQSKAERIYNQFMADLATNIAN